MISLILLIQLSRRIVQVSKRKWRISKKDKYNFKIFKIRHASLSEQTSPFQIY